MVYRRPTRVIVAAALAIFVACAWPAAALPPASSDIADAARPPVKAYTDREGLPQNKISAMAIDATGYLWIGTQDGAAFYNGHEWTVVNSPISRVGTDIVTMLVDGEAIWLGLRTGGLHRLEHGAWTKVEAPTLPSNNLRALLAAPGPSGAPALWAATDAGLACLEGGVWRTFDVASGLPAPVVTCLALWKRAGAPPALLAGTEAGLAVWESGRWTVPDPFRRFDGVTIRALMSDEDGALWVGTEDRGLLRFDGASWTTYDAEAGLADGVYAVAETRAADGARVVWAGTQFGVFRMTGGRFVKIGVEDGIPNPWVISLLVTPDDGTTEALWVGTESGLARLQQGRWQTIAARHGLAGDSTFSIVEAPGPKGGPAFWFGSHGGVAVYENGTWTRYDASSGLPSGIVWFLRAAAGPDGPELWAATEAGLAVFRSGRWRTIDEPGAPRNTCYAVLARDEDGEQIVWVAAADGLYRRAGGTWTRYTTESGLPSNNVWCLNEGPGPDGRNTLLIGSDGGLVAATGDPARPFALYPDLPENQTGTVAEISMPDGARALWVGWYQGGAAFKRIDDPTAEWQIISTTTSPALPNNIAYSIRADARHRVYISSNKGVSRLTPKVDSPRSFADYEIETFGREDGLPSFECNGEATLVDSRGRIWMGTPKGVAFLDPAEEIAPALPRLVVERTLRDGVPRMIAEGEELSHDEQNLTFEFALLSFFREGETRYRTQLVGLEEHPTEWTPMASREFATLPEGDYTLRVWARDWAGSVVAPAEISFGVRPAPWKTWWAYTIYLLSLVALVTAAVRSRVNALQRRTEELEARVAERTAALAASNEAALAAERGALEAKEEAIRANRAKSTFLANMSHELRTPLNAIIGYAQLLERGASLGPEQSDQLQVIARSGDHLLSLINDVLSVSKIEAGQQTLNESVFDLHAFLDGIEAMFRLRAHAKGLRLLFEVGPNVPHTVRADEGKLRQVLINLLGNAVKFTDSGGVALRMRYGHNRAFFEVEDTGYGIAPDEIETLFDAFVQTEAGRRSKEGTGLGLAISRSFVELMGGTISVRSEVGRGTTFSLEVAMQEAPDVEAVSRARRVSRLDPSFERRRLLVVDDRADNRNLLVGLLRAVGFEVREAANGLEAVEVWEAWRPDLIWMDMRMPVMDGEEATRAIRERERAQRSALGTRHSCKIVALTASAFEREREAILASGCDDFVTKPFREATIFDKLAEHLGARFVYEEGETREAAPIERIAVDRLRALPPALRSELREAVHEGDVAVALEVVERIGLEDAKLAAELRGMLKRYELDAVIVALDACGAAV